MALQLRQVVRRFRFAQLARAPRETSLLRQSVRCFGSIGTPPWLSSNEGPDKEGFEIIDNTFTRSFSSSGDVKSVLVDLPDSVPDAQVGEWVKGLGDLVREDDVVCVLDTDKTAQDVSTPVEGKIVAVHFEEGDTVENKQALFDVEQMEVPADADADNDANNDNGSVQNVESNDASSKKDENKETSKIESETPKIPEPVAAESSREETRTRMPKIREVIAKHLKNSQNTAASLTTFNEIDMTNLIAMRNKYKDEFLETHGVKLGFMSPFLKACAKALQELPSVNNAIDGQDILERNYVDISVAVATPKGLVTPIVRDVHNMSLAEIELSIANLAARARDNKLAIEDLKGGTFTVSNGGVFGNMMGTPIINSPQSAVFGMHATKMRPAVVDGEVVPRPIMYIALTYDHRIIDGREAATFLCRVRDKIEDPLRMFLEI